MEQVRIFIGMAGVTAVTLVLLVMQLHMDGYAVLTA